MQEIVDAVRNRTCVVFGGAGISRDAGLPSWFGLATQLYDRLNANGHVPEEYQSAIGPLIKNNATFRPGLDMLLSVVRRSDVAKELREILDPKENSSEVHHALKRLNLRGFLTTNYDRLLESAISTNAWNLRNSGEDLKSFHTAVTSPGVQFLLKLHGDIDNTLPSDDIKVMQGAAFMVLSKADYSVFQAGRLNDIRLAFHSVLQQYSVLFLGYGFGDPHINETLAFLAEHCQFSRPSWFVGLKGQLPTLPNNVTAIQPIEDWTELAEWLGEIDKAVKEALKVSQTEEPPLTEISEELRHAVQVLGEYISGLESENLCERTIACILVPELVGKESLESSWLSERIGKVLNIGPIWADTFSKAAIRHLIDLKLIEPRDGGQTFRVIKTRVNRLHQRASSEWTEDRSQFFESVKRRLAISGDDLSESFIANLDEVIQHLCLGFGKRMAEWVLGGIGRDIGLLQIHELVSVYFNDADDRRRVEELLGLIFDKPNDGEISYVYRLLSSAFLLNSVKLDPTAAKFLKESISDYEIYLDSNVLLPLLIEEDKNHPWMRTVISESKEAGASLYVIEHILNEVYGHEKIADKIMKAYRDSEGLEIYLEVHGPRANRFIQGYARIPKEKRSRPQEYLSGYSKQKIDDMLHKIGVEIVRVDQTQWEPVVYKNVYNDIAEEWNRKVATANRFRLDLVRASVLTEDEAKQFLHLYQRRREEREKGKSDNIWFLSFETVLQKVYLRNPQVWGKPPTFPVSAWAGFLDSRLTSQPKNRRDILNAIIKGNSTTYALPDTVSMVRRRAFGERVLSKVEFGALQTSVSNAMFLSKLEKTRDAVEKRSHRDPSVTKEFAELQEEAVAKVEDNLSEEIDRLKRQLSENQSASAEEIARLKQRIDDLSAQMKRRRRHKTRGQA